MASKNFQSSEFYLSMEDCYMVNKINLTPKFLSKKKATGCVRGDLRIRNEKQTFFLVFFIKIMENGK